MDDINPIIEDLECKEDKREGEHKSNAVADIANAIETILSEEHIDQKTIITSENEIGLIGIDVLQAHFLKSFKHSYPSLVALKMSKQEHAVSVGGKRSEQIVEIFKSIQTQIITSDIPLSQRLLGKR